jgi:chromosome segregation ATPase
MRIEDLKSWTVDQLKEEIVRLADERESKQHEILDLKEKIAEMDKSIDEMTLYIDSMKEKPKAISDSRPDTKWYDERHQPDCITINQLQTALDVIVDRYANLRKTHGVS